MEFYEICFQFDFFFFFHKGRNQNLLNPFFLSFLPFIIFSFHSCIILHSYHCPLLFHSPFLCVSFLSPFFFSEFISSSLTYTFTIFHKYGIYILVKNIQSISSTAFSSRLPISLFLALLPPFLTFFSPYLPISYPFFTLFPSFIICIFHFSFSLTICFLFIFLLYLFSLIFCFFLCFLLFFSLPQFTIYFSSFLLSQLLSVSLLSLSLFSSLPFLSSLCHGGQDLLFFHPSSSREVILPSSIITCRFLCTVVTLKSCLSLSLT